MRTEMLISKVLRALFRRWRLLRLTLAAFRLRHNPPPHAVNPVGDGRTVISDGYKALNEQMHEERAGYGVQAIGHLSQMRILTRLFSRDVLDYGCGKQLLERGLGFPIQNYDPGIPGLDSEPQPADVVACLDVLEHIEPELLEGVLNDLARVTQRVGYFVISTELATKNLPDGRNAHLIVESPEWWHKQMEKHFEIRLRLDDTDHATFLVGPR